jgi:hypothetical protein
MNKHLVAIFIAILDNKVVYHETNALAFHAAILKDEKELLSYQRLLRLFSKNDYFTLELSGKQYFFQKLV